MPKCIYCLQDGTTTIFKAREHVIPRCLGTFQPLNPTLTSRDGLVCDKCNASIFNPLETIFMEDTLEGVHGQRLNIQGKNSVTIRSHHFKVEQRLTGFGKDFFTQMFFFLKPKDGKIVPNLKNQIKIRRRQGGYRVFSPEALESMRKGSSEFQKISADLQKLDQKNMCIFGESQESVDKMVVLLKRFGVTYKEKARHSKFFKPGDKIQLDENYTCRLNIDLGRVLAKIAFNYFAYCAKQSALEHILYLSNFDKIRRFVHSGSGVKGIKEIIPSISEEPILWEEKAEGKRFIAHFVNFRAEEGYIVARMTFFGLPPIYKIIVGPVPKELNKTNFGCGHVFNPFNGWIGNLSQQVPEAPTEEQLRLSFSLFKRI